MAQRSEIDPIASLREPNYLLFLIGSMLSNTGNQMRAVAVGLGSLPSHARADQPGLRWLGPRAAGDSVRTARWGARRSLLAQKLDHARSGRARGEWARPGVGVVDARAAGVDLLFSVLHGHVSRARLARVDGDRRRPRADEIISQCDDVAERGLSIGRQRSGRSSAGSFSPGGTRWPCICSTRRSSLILIACLLFVRPRSNERVAEPHSWRSVMDGIHYLWRHPVILSTMVLDMVAVLFGGVTALLPIYATDVLNVGAAGFGWLRAMPSVGAIAMSLWLATRPPIRRAGTTLLWAVVAFGVATIVFGLSKSYPLSLAMLFALGAADNISVVIRSTVLQLLTPDSMRGRVSAVGVIFIGTSNEMGELESGVAAQWLGRAAGGRRRRIHDARDRGRRGASLAGAGEAGLARAPGAAGSDRASRGVSRLTRSERESLSSSGRCVIAAAASR